MSARASIDLNADVGEGAGTDGDLVPLVSSVNIACGAHAGDEVTMREAVLLALGHGVAIGAHPGFEDRENFGRREVAIAPSAAAALVVDQVARLQAVARRGGAVVGHIKLHGALYNMAARDAPLADAVVRAVAGMAAGPRVMYALAGSLMVAAGRDAGLTMVGEAFADRTYRDDGSLTPRSEPGSVIEDAAESAAQALGIATRGSLVGRSGKPVAIDARTICVHGDSPGAVASARAIRAVLLGGGVAIGAFY